MLDVADLKMRIREALSTRAIFEALLQWQGEEVAAAEAVAENSPVWDLPLLMFVWKSGVDVSHLLKNDKFPPEMIEALSIWEARRIIGESSASRRGYARVNITGIDQASPLKEDAPAIQLLLEALRTPHKESLESNQLEVLRFFIMNYSGIASATLEKVYDIVESRVAHGARHHFVLHEKATEEFRAKVIRGFPKGRALAQQSQSSEILRRDDIRLSPICRKELVRMVLVAEDSAGIELLVISSPD